MSQAVSQHMAALGRAQEVRIGIAHVRREIRSLSYDDGRQMLAGILLAPDDIIGAAQVRSMLLAIHRFGESSARRFMREVGIVAGDRRIRDLSERQRVTLADLLAPEDKP